MIEGAPEILGNRHLLEFDEARRASFLAGRVRITASPEVTASRCGQITLWFLINLLARQFNVIHRLYIDATDAEMLPGVALFASRRSLLDTLVATAHAITRDAMAITLGGRDAVDIEIRVGPNGSIKTAAPRSLSVWGAGWRSFAGEHLDVPVHDSDNPMGAILAACFGAAECFRIVTNWKGAAFLPPRYYSVWDGLNYPSWKSLPEGCWPEVVTLPPFYLCGAGAVGQALAAVVGSCPKRCGRAVVLDHDPIDATNINRYVLVHRDLDTSDKTVIAARCLRSPEFEVQPVQLSWEQYVSTHANRTSAIITGEKEYKYELVISCVDKNQGRHAIQNLWPRRIFGGSSLGLGAQIMRYDVGRGDECLKCNNPLSIEPTIEDQAAGLRALSPQELEDELAILQPNERDAVRAYLSTPRCGTVGAHLINQLGEKVRREFAVGFVSVGAGVMLAGALIQHALGKQGIFGGAANHLSLSFEHQTASKSLFLGQSNCECRARGRSLYKQLWGV